MNRRDFLKNAVKTSFIFAAGLWVPKLGILRSADAEASFFQHAAGASGFLTRVHAGITMKLSKVAGTAFATQVSGSIPWAQYRNRSVSINDGTGKYARGFIGAVGSGETYSSEILVGWNFTSGWTPSNATIVDANTIQSTLANGSISKAYSLIVGRLYKGVMAGAISSGSPVLGYTSGGDYLLSDFGTGFKTNNGSNGIIVRAATSGAILDVTTLELYQVLTPDSTGILVTSTRGGATQSFASVDAGFNSNAASFTVTVSA